MDLNKLRYDLALICTQVSLLSDKTDHNYDYDMNATCLNALDAFAEAYKTLNSYADELLLEKISE